MSTSLLYHAWSIRGYNYVTTRYEKGTVIFEIEPNSDNLMCTNCQSSNWIYKGYRVRTLQTLPIGPRKVFLEVKIPRILCHDCQTLKEIDPPFAEPLRTYTKALENYAIELCRITTIKGASHITGLSWHIVKDIDKRYLKKKYKKIPLKGVRYLAIDEFAIAKGHKYMTGVIDLQKGRILHVGDGKDGNAVIPFLQHLKRIRDYGIEAVAIDMSPAYLSAVRETLLNVPIVFDHFHVIKRMNERLDELRRAIFRRADNPTQQLLKGVRFLVLMGSENLTELEKVTPGSQERLNKALAINQPLNIGYYLKEKLRILWSLKTKKEGTALLQEWCQEAQSSGITQMKKMANTLHIHEEQILSYFDHPISTGPLEGINNKIKTLKRQSYGFRDMEYFKLRLFDLHETQYVLMEHKI
jgi:transposase